MKVLILAGGSGTRLSEYTYEIPKPMVNNIPMIVHIMNLYAKYGFKEFIMQLVINPRSLMTISQKMLKALFQKVKIL